MLFLVTNSHVLYESQKDKSRFATYLISSLMTYLSHLEELFFQQAGIPMGTNCAPLIADLFLYSYETEIRQILVNNKNITDPLN